MVFPGVVPLRTGPSPAYAMLAAPVPVPADENRAPALEQHEKLRIRSAAFRATRLYPGPVGELLQRELLCWEEFNHRFDQRGLAGRLVAHILTTPIEPR